MVNLAPLQAALNETLINPKHHDQKMWSVLNIAGHELRSREPEWREPIPLTIDCGTKSCLFGIVCEQANYRFVYEGSYMLMNVVLVNDKNEKIPDPDWNTDQFNDAAYPQYAKTVAARILDLTDAEAIALADADNETVELWSVAFAISGGQIDLDVPGAPELSHIVDTLREWAAVPEPEIAWLTDGDSLESITAARYLVAKEYWAGQPIAPVIPTLAEA